MINKISLYDKVLFPVVTEKSTNMSDQNKVVFKVNRTSNKNILKKKSVIKSIRTAEKLIKGQGRILLRKSGTEQKIRIMAESLDKKLIFKCIKLIKRSIY